MEFLLGSKHSLHHILLEEKWEVAERPETMLKLLPTVIYGNYRKILKIWKFKVRKLAVIVPKHALKIQFIGRL